MAEPIINRKVLVTSTFDTALLVPQLIALAASELKMKLSIGLTKLEN